MTARSLAELSDDERALVSRWRLVLGKDAERSGVCLSPGAGGENSEGTEEALGFLFDDDRGAGSESSQLTVPSWIDTVSELFPRQAKEVLERELVKRKGIHQILDQPDLLERIEPNVELVKTLLTHKDLLTPKTRVLARKVIDKVVQELKRKLEVRVEQAITGALRKDRHSPRRVFRNVDLKTTLRRNLKNWNQEREKLFVDKVWFYAAEKNKRPWHVIVCVDQSGSMLESAIFSSIMASIFAELPGVKTSLVLFDTQVVDLSNQVGEPVDVLLSVQLGGGTDITRALEYCSTIVREPARTILVLITDFYEGRPEADLVRVVTNLADANVRMVGLGALGYDAQPQYNRQTAGKLRKVGMDILVCTPEKLADCMGKIIRG
ncbi:Mg-chelatase subunit ChlD [Labilithrix luteola]|uniref:Mg-chelatase subunit ChlD n=1 Tax=Labilithrix luteola TaxID=1391654 RepID=A0A0K1PLE4_9BACT|nr:VWA domain-containing protein [Labilithrix luteola]AKU93939.1 Mg-chelatase subunit ChlD [Labilithrix luteola]